MALALAPQPLTSPAIEDGADRLYRAGWLDRLERGTPYIDSQEHPHWRWLAPSEGTSECYVLDLDLGTGAVACTCPGGEHYGRCKHARCLKKFRIDRARIMDDPPLPRPDLDARIAQLERHVASLERGSADVHEWLSEMGADVAVALRRYAEMTAERTAR
jgi:uncharacterized Zn finger protein